MECALFEDTPQPSAMHSRASSFGSGSEAGAGGGLRLDGVSGGSLYAGGGDSQGGSRQGSEAGEGGEPECGSHAPSLPQPDLSSMPSLEHASPPSSSSTSAPEPATSSSSTSAPKPATSPPMGGNSLSYFTPPPALLQVAARLIEGGGGSPQGSVDSERSGHCMDCIGLHGATEIGRAHV